LSQCVAVGYEAGFNLTTGSNNIDIGSQGAAAESGVIRIGTITGTTSTQKATYIAGIYNVTTGGLAVVIDSKGQLGTTSSSARFKTAIMPLGSESAKLQELRPVSFHYKADPRGERRYGLIAEEVAQVYPELVVRNEQGRIDGVRYDELAPLLLNEVQKQSAEIRELKERLKSVDEMQLQLTETRALLLRLQSKDDRAPQR
jgi:Chaperone of endosialidase